MDDEVELISDGDGLAVIGSPTAVERFIASVGLTATAGSRPLGAAFSAGAAAAQIGSAIAANSGRWVKLTKESAEAVERFGFTPTETPGVSYAMAGPRGDIKQWIQVVKTPGLIVSSPAVLAGAAGVMAQLAMQQQMKEITDYLATIDKKLDAVLRSQTNQVLARLDGVALAAEEAMSVRDAVGRVSEVTWSKIENSAQTIHETQGYALRQLGDLADKIEEKNRIGDLAETAKEAAAEVRKWLIVLARCFVLHDAVAVLELDRVLDASPDELDRHRLGLQSARRKRMQLVSERTDRLLSRMDAAVAKANSKVLFNPKQSPTVVRSSNDVAAGVHEFHQLIGIESARTASESRRWSEAAADRWDSTRATGAAGVAAVKGLGEVTGDRARSVRKKLSKGIAERTSRQSDVADQHDEQD